MKPILLMRVFSEDGGCVWELYDCGQERMMEVEIHDRN